jgi:hypothetical protein
METLLTEIIGFFWNCEGVSGLRGGTAAASLILPCSSGPYRGFTRMIADQDLAVNKRETSQSECMYLMHK